MKRIVVIAVLFSLLALFATSVWAGGDKVRGEKGEGEVNQVNFDNQGNQN